MASHVHTRIPRHNLALKYLNSGYLDELLTVGETDLSREPRGRYFDLVTINGRTFRTHFCGSPIMTSRESVHEVLFNSQTKSFICDCSIKTTLPTSNILPCGCRLGWGDSGVHNINMCIRDHPKGKGWFWPGKKLEPLPETSSRSGPMRRLANAIGTSSSSHSFADFGADESSNGISGMTITTGDPSASITNGTYIAMPGQTITTGTITPTFPWDPSVSVTNSMYTTGMNSSGEFVLREPPHAYGRMVRRAGRPSATSGPLLPAYPLRFTSGELPSSATSGPLLPAYPLPSAPPSQPSYYSARPPPRFTASIASLQPATGGPHSDIFSSYSSPPPPPPPKSKLLVTPEKGIIPDDPTNVCTICMEFTPVVLFMPCQHNVLCTECAIEWAKKNNGKLTCTDCRSDVEFTINLKPFKFKCVNSIFATPTPSPPVEPPV